LTNSNISADPTVNAEELQAYLLQAMRNIGFTEQQIEENRKHNGCLYLTGPAYLAAIRGRLEPGAQIHTVTGELRLSKAAQLEQLMDMFDEVIDEAEARFEDLDDPVQRSAFVELLRYATARLEEVEHELEA
jgi:hypothetical protein